MTDQEIQQKAQKIKEIYRQFQMKLAEINHEQKQLILNFINKLEFNKIEEIERIISKL